MEIPTLLLVIFLFQCIYAFFSLLFTLTLDLHSLLTPQFPPPPAKHEVKKNKGKRKQPPTPLPHPKPRGKPKGRRGAGRKKPRAYDEFVTVTWSAHSSSPRCSCGGHLHIHDSYQRSVWDLRFKPRLLHLVRIHFTLYRYRCHQCGQFFIPRPYGVLSHSRLGLNLVGYLLYKRVILHQPVRSIVEELAQFLGESFSAPTVLYYVKRMAQLLGDVYDLLVEEVRRAESVHVDETGCPINGEQWWTWVFATKTVVVYRIAKSRGHEVVEEVLRDFKGTLLSDFYTAYDPLPYAKQKCLVHLLRRLEAALKREEKTQEGKKGHQWEEEDRELRAFIFEVRALFQGAIDEAKERKKRREIVEKEKKKEGDQEVVEHVKGELKAGRGGEEDAKEDWGEKRREAERRLDALLGREYGSSEVKKVVKLLKKHKGSLFRFLKDPQVGWENNAAERALRPLVVQRKRSGGYRRDESAQAHAILYSIAETWRMRGENFIEVLTAVG